MIKPLPFMLIVLLAVASVSTSAEPGVDYEIDVIASGLDHPWSLAFLADGRMLVTERAGRLRIIENEELKTEPVEDVPQAYVASQGGLLEVLPHPDWAENGWIYLSLAYGDRGANTTLVLRGRLHNNRLIDQQEIFRAEPTRDTPVHYGGRMAFLPDNSLLITLGDGFNFREQAQNPGNHTGTIVRVTDSGEVPADNPFVGHSTARPEIYSYGHRNVQGIVYDARNNRIWSHEHGPRGGDELNLIVAGANYGWPVVTEGLDYSGARITPHRSLPGMRGPHWGWTPSTAPAGLALYLGDQFPEWQGDLLVASLVDRSIIRLRMDEDSVIDEEYLFAEIGERLRDVRVGPDDAIYILTDSAEGQLLRVRRSQ